jgi:hypothetical protein
MKIKEYLAIFIAAVFLMSCGAETAKKEENKEAKVEVKVEKKEAVTIRDGLSVRAEPNKDGKWLSRLSLGEKVLYLGESKIDSTEKNNYEYHHVELSDGNQVWAYGYGLLIDAKPAVVIDGTPIYKRPDLVTKTKEDLEVMEFVAIVGEKDEWVEIVNAGKKKKGWIKKEYLVDNDEDVAVSIMAYKSLKNENGEIVIGNIPAFIEEIPFPESRFIPILQKMYDLEQEKDAAFEKKNDEAADAEAEAMGL